MALRNRIASKNLDVRETSHDPGIGRTKGIQGELASTPHLSSLCASAAEPSPDRFARDLAVQLAGHDMLKGLGIAIIPASAPDFFTEDTPTAVLVRQVLGAIAQFEKASAVDEIGSGSQTQA